MCFLRLQCWSEENSHRSQLKYLIFSWTKSTCSFSSLIWQAENWHSAHLNRLGSLWTAAIWHLSWLLFAAEYVQRSHLNLKSFSDPCTALTCSLRCGFRPKVLSHTWHWKGFTFSWKIWRVSSRQKWMRESFRKSGRRKTSQRRTGFQAFNALPGPEERWSTKRRSVIKYFVNTFYEYFFSTDCRRWLLTGGHVCLLWLGGALNQSNRLTFGFFAAAIVF